MSTAPLEVVFLCRVETPTGHPIPRETRTRQVHGTCTAPPQGTQRGPELTLEDRGTGPSVSEAPGLDTMLDSLSRPDSGLELTSPKPKPRGLVAGGEGRLGRGQTPPASSTLLPVLPAASRTGPLQTGPSPGARSSARTAARCSTPRKGSTATCVSTATSGPRPGASRSSR